MNNNLKEINPNLRITEFTGTLYHGAIDDFKFDPNFDYNNPEVNNYDGSATLGEGLYLTNKADIALDYSQVRQRGRDEKEIFLRLHRFKLGDFKFWDLTDENNHNIHVPSEIISKWKDHFEDYYNSLPPVKGEKYTITPPPSGSNIGRKIINREFMEREEMASYLGYLRELVDKKSDADLRVMLGTGPSIENLSNFQGDRFGLLWGNLFRQFVIDILKCDGIIYCEVSEGLEKKDHLTYIAYNLNKIQPEPSILENRAIKK